MTALTRCRQAWRRAVCAVLLACHAHPAWAISEGPVGPYFHTGWTASDGAPTDVFSMAQDREGWLWLASAQGLYRFDGERFERIDSVNGQRLRRSNVMAVAYLDGALWLGYQFGGAERIQDGKLTFFGKDSGFPEASVQRFVQQPGGPVSAATSAGLYDWDGQRWRRAWPEPASRPRGAAFALVTGDGDLVFNAEQRHVLRRKRGANVFEPVSSGEPVVTSLFAGKEGGFWATTALDFMEYDRARDSIPAAVPRATPDGANDLYFLRSGAVWLNSAAGISLVRDTRSFTPVASLGKARGLSDDSALTGMEDREGNLWLGTSGGIDRLRPRRAQALEHGLNVAFPSLALAADGALWIGSKGALPVLEVAPDGKVRKQRMVEVESMLASADGGVWAGNAKLVTHYVNGREQSWPLPGGRPNQVQMMAEDQQGGLWISMIGNRELYRLYRGNWENHTQRLGYPYTPICLAVDARNRLWQTFTDNAVAVADGDQVTRYGSKDGLRLGNVLSVAVKGEHVWLGGEDAVMYLRGGRFVALSGNDGRDFTGVSGIVELDNGDLWLNGAQGITHIAAADLRRALAEGSAVAYERLEYRDGVVGQAPPLRPLPSLLRGQDGKLWYVTHSGIGWIDPAHMVRNPLAPPVLVRGLVADQRSYAPAPGLRLPEGSSSLRIDYTALALTMPERVRFRYRLLGVDKDWVDPGRRRSAFYTNLGPGNYRFEVHAANEDGVWNSTGATAEFAIAPTVVQTGWFRALCLLLAALLLYGLHRWRLHRQALQLRARMEERLDERGRIARELHDTLLQSVQGLVLRVHGALVRLPAQEPVRDILDQALAQAEDTIVEGRNLVRDLRSRDDGLALPAMLSAVSRELGADGGPRCMVNTLNQLRPLRTEASNELFAIGREALINAFKHARAEQVTVTIDYGERELRLTVVDDGVGIPDQVLVDGGRAGHWGLAGMRERAVRAGAQLALRRGAMGGTECELHLPAARAYATPAPRAGWRWLWRLRRQGR